LVLFIIIFSFFASLLFVTASKADYCLVINGSHQMSVGSSQTLTVSGGCSGHYTWSIVSGGGYLSGATGNSVNYTAPPANPNCANNPTICVTDSSGQQTCMQIAVNVYSSNSTAYWVNECGDEGYCNYASSPGHGTFCATATVAVNAYSCSGKKITAVSGCSNGGKWCMKPGGPPYVPCSCDECFSTKFSLDPLPYCQGLNRTLEDMRTCESLSEVCCGAVYHPYPLNEPDDKRTDAQKAAGCCPAALVSSPPPPVCVSDCVPDCDLKIESFYGSSTTINPKSGGTINFSGGISSSKPVTWTVIVAGKTFNGTGNSVFVSWDGRNSAGKVVDPGSYTATLSASATDDPSCSNSKTIPFTVKENDGCSSGLSVIFYSQLNIGSGNLYHSQNLFTVPNSKLMSGFTFSYNSTDSYNGILGTGWTHTYNINLKANTHDGSYILTDGRGSRTVLYKNEDVYTPETSAYPVLTKNADNTLTVSYKNRTTQTFNSQGQLIKIADKNGNATQLTYNAGNNLITITDSSGKIISFNYDPTSKISSITDPNNNNYTFTHSGEMLTRVSSQNTLGNQTWVYTYDTNAFMLTKTDPQGNLTQYAYDVKHRVIQSIDPAGNARNVQYDEANKTTTITEKDGGNWVYKYDTNLGVLTSKTDPSGSAISYEYNTNGDMIKKIEADGTTTSNTYDEFGNLTSTTDALGNTTTYAYNEQNLITSITDAAGKITQYSYDANGNMLSITDPAGATTQYAYDAKGNITSITNPLGKITNMTYDQYNNLISTTDPTGATITMTYDALGNMTSQTDAAGNITTFQYNSLNQMIAVIDSTGKITNYTYDAKGNILTTTDANGNKTTNTYNYRNQLIQTTDAIGNITAFAYGGSGCSSCGGGTDKLTSITDAKNQQTTYEYDQTGKLIKETDPLGNFTMYTYDAKGNMIAKTKPDGRTINYIYDAAGRLLEKRYPNNTADIFQYDQTGNVIMATTNQNIAYYYSYDAANRLTGVTDSNLHNIDYQYDVAGNRIAMTTPDGKTIRYEYNAGNQMTKILTNRGSYIFTYDALNRRIKKTLPNGTFTTYAYDPNSRLTNITHKNAFNKIIDSFSYTHDNVGNRLTKTDEASSPHDPDKTINYRYDNIYRLLNATPEKKGKGKLEDAIIKHHTESYSYDPVGNRQTGPKANDSYTYNTGNALTQFNKISGSPANAGYEYDPNGNLIKKTETLAKGHHSIITTYAYDDENRLTEVKIQKGHKVKEVSFTYDPLGRRISKTLHKEEFVDDEDADNENDNDKGKNEEKDKFGKHHYPRTTYYVYDNQNIIAEYDDNGKLIASYIHGPNTDEPLSAEIRNDWIYYHADGLGSITALTSHMGHAVQRYEYDSFGNMKPTPHWIKQPYTFTGREFDQETGLYYYRARYYDAKAGRFITKDPIGFDSGDYNLYVYVGNNPMNATDPSGLAVTISILRDIKTNISISGTINVNSNKGGGSFSAFTLERILTKGQVPAGSYTAFLRKDYNPWRIQLLGTEPLFSGIQIHNGSYPDDSKGCFLVGTNRSKDFVNGSITAMNRILEIIKKDCTEDITVKVLNYL
jgi:RHS repeat-associated protein